MTVTLKNFSFPTIIDEGVIYQKWLKKLKEIIQNPEKGEKTALIKHKALLSLSKNGFTESIKLHRFKKEVIVVVLLIG